MKSSTDPRYALHDYEISSAVVSWGDAIAKAVETGDAYAVDGMMLTPVAFTQGGFARFVADDDDRTASIG